MELITRFLPTVYAVDYLSETNSEPFDFTACFNRSVLFLFESYFLYITLSGEESYRLGLVEISDYAKTPGKKSLSIV